MKITGTIVASRWKERVGKDVDFVWDPDNEELDRWTIDAMRRDAEIIARDRADRVRREAMVLLRQMLQSYRRSRV